MPTCAALQRAGGVQKRAAELLGWKATRTIDDMCADTWRWQSQNPQGFTG